MPAAGIMTMPNGPSLRMTSRTIAERLAHLQWGSHISGTAPVSYRGGAVLIFLAGEQGVCRGASKDSVVIRRARHQSYEGPGVSMSLRPGARAQFCTFAECK